MLSRLVFTLKYFFFWILYFFALKLVFLLYFHRESFQYFGLWYKIYLKGFRLDLSATGYLMLIPLLILLISIWLPGKWALIFTRVYTYSFVGVISFLIAADLGLYRDWGFRLDVSPIMYLSKPKEAFASVSALYIISHLMIAFIFTFSFIYIFKVFINRINFKKYGNRQWLSSILYLLLTGFMIIPIRGGTGKAPLSGSSAYFSEVSFLNHAALNLPWNIIFSVFNMNTTENPFLFLRNDQAEILSRNFTKSSSKHFNILKTKRPNIILVVLESFTANVTGCLNGSVQVTPELDRIAKKGILFSHLYASGDRTDKAMLAIISGFPAQPTTSLINYLNKTETLPSLPKILKKNGYHSVFYYGGNVEFANYKSYLINAGFEKIFDIKEFPASQYISKWGVPDEFLFQRIAEDLKHERQPYFITLFTISSHTPYDVPMKPHIEGNSGEIKFYNSIYYTDLQLGKFIENLENGGMLKNTLVIILADHGFQYPGNLSYNSFNKFHIPMIWCGGALTLSDTIISTISSQTDIANTLLSQLGITTDQFRYSKNSLAENAPGKITYEINNGFGYVSDSLIYYYYLQSDKFAVEHGQLNEDAKMEGKAFYQVLYNDILNR